MGERPDQRRGRGGIVLLRLVFAAAAIAVLAGLTSDLLDKASSSSPRPRTRPAEDPPPDDGEPPEHRPPQRVHVGDPTVYDAQKELSRCATRRRDVGPSSSAPGLADDVHTISSRVERIRRLDFERPVDTRIVSRAEVGQRFARGFLRRYGEREAARDAQVLAALRLVPEGTDVRALTSRFLGRGVGGFYNPRKDRLYAARSASALTAYDEVVLAHELDHALVDQVLRLPGTLSRDPMLGDVMLARQALAEGDATLVMTRYAAARFTPEEHESFMARFSPRAIRPRSDIPYVFARASGFPYYEGLLFACSEWRARGWDAVNEMYLRPPATTADLLFPFRYYGDVAARLPRPAGPPGRSWGRGYARSFGAFDVMVLLENADLLSGGETVPGSHVDAVRGWAGGVLHSWLRGPETTIRIALVDAGVETKDGRRRRLCDVMRRWYLETYPDAVSARVGVPNARAWTSGGEHAVLRCDGSAVDLAKGPSAAALRRILAG